MIGSILQEANSSRSTVACSSLVSYDVLSTLNWFSPSPLPSRWVNRRWALSRPTGAASPQGQSLPELARNPGFRKSFLRLLPPAAAVCQSPHHLIQATDPVLAVE